jgi:hypothetical protein
MFYGFRSYKSFCPFCGTLNNVSDGTGSIEEIKCSHFQLVCSAGGGSNDMIFQLGKMQKSGLDQPAKVVFSDD